MTTETWQIDSSHSGIHFAVRHLVIAKVRGQFGRWTGALTAPDGDTRPGVSVGAGPGSLVARGRW